ncbi:hypothetical protein B4086_5795 [Bacillus cereus]|nr:hypothetical protein B4086_5795 [Bacillus cereus]
MECPHCGAELEYASYWYRGIYGTETYHKLGDIYKCPNFEGFEDKEEAKAYVETNNLEVGEGKEVETIDEVSCESFSFNGFFYTDEQDNLHEGYPC